MMRRACALAVVALPAALVFAAACGGGSSGSKAASPNASTSTAVSALRKQATVLPNGTVVVKGTPLSGADAAALAGSSAYLLPPGTRVAGTPGAAATSGLPAPGGTPVPVPSGAATFPPFTPGAVVERTEIPATPANVAPSDGFSLAVPATASGDFDVAVNIAGGQAYYGFNVTLAYDPNLLEVKGIDPGSTLPSDQRFCAPSVIGAGRAAQGCVVLGSDPLTAAGPIAVYHFHAKGSGSVTIHVMTYQEGGEESGTFLIGHTQGGDPQPLTVPTHDANVTVSP